MKCLYVIDLGRHIVPCGQCILCRRRRRSELEQRIKLELLAHTSAAWITLTYSDEHLPRRENLCLKHVQVFLKRLRRRLGFPFRYVAAGEYGDKFGRPHYHLLLFGVEPTCELAEQIESAWQIGRIQVGRLQPSGVGYIVKDIVKQYTRDGEAVRRGRIRPFVKWSRGGRGRGRQGIGAIGGMDLGLRSAAAALNDAAHHRGGVYEVPKVFKHGVHAFPLGRYLRARLFRLLDPKHYQLECVGVSGAMELAKKFAFRTGQSVGSVLYDVNISEARAIDGRTQLRRRSAL